MPPSHRIFGKWDRCSTTFGTGPLRSEREVGTRTHWNITIIYGQLSRTMKHTCDRSGCHGILRGPQIGQGDGTRWRDHPNFRARPSGQRTSEGQVGQRGWFSPVTSHLSVGRTPCCGAHRGQWVLLPPECVCSESGCCWERLQAGQVVRLSDSLGGRRRQYAHDRHLPFVCNTPAWNSTAGWGWGASVRPGIGTCLLFCSLWLFGNRRDAIPSRYVVTWCAGGICHARVGIQPDGFALQIDFRVDVLPTTGDFKRPYPTEFQDHKPFIPFTFSTGNNHKQTEQ